MNSLFANTLCPPDNKFFLSVIKFSIYFSKRHARGSTLEAFAVKTMIYERSRLRAWGSDLHTRLARALN